VDGSATADQDEVGGDSLLPTILEVLADRVETGVFVTLLGGRTLYANQCIARMAGYPDVEAFKQVSATELYVDADARARLIKELTETGRVRRLETRSRRADGSVYWVALSAVLADTPAGRAIVGTVHDITEQKVAELELQQSEERYRLLIEHSPEAVYVHRGGRFIFANAAGVQLMGARDAAELIDTPILDRIHPDDRPIVLERVRRSLGSAEPAPLREERFVRLDGSIVHVEVNAVAITMEGQPAMLTMVRDITERHESEERLQKVQRLESLGVLAGGIAHDFNNLLGGIYGHVELAAMDLRRGQPETAAEHLSEVQAVFSRATHLTGQLLTFARGGAPARCPGDLGETVGAAVRFALSGSNVRCVIEADEDLWGCSFDAHQISQVVDNLVINAVQAMPRGGCLRVRLDNVPVTPGAALQLPAGRYVRFTIEDEGTGIPAEILPRIFDPFFSTRAGGTGLGLATGWSIIHRHGGTIEVRSELGRGTRFQCYLPASDAPAASARPAAAPSTGRGRVLFMDDEPYMRRVVSAMLEQSGYTITTAAEGRQAIACYRDAIEAGARYDVVIVDLTVPGGMGGAEVLRELRAVDPAVRVIASSGYAYDPIMADPAAVGFAAVLAKPYDLATLTGTLDRVLGDEPPAR